MKSTRALKWLCFSALLWFPLCAHAQSSQIFNDNWSLIFGLGKISTHVNAMTFKQSGQADQDTTLNTSGLALTAGMRSAIRPFVGLTDLPYSWGGFVQFNALDDFGKWSHSSTLNSDAVKMKDLQHLTIGGEFLLFTPQGGGYFRLETGMENQKMNLTYAANNQKESLSDNSFFFGYGVGARFKDTTIDISSRVVSFSHELKKMANSTLKNTVESTTHTLSLELPF